jgi:hypothetical protein
MSTPGMQDAICLAAMQRIATWLTLGMFAYADRLAKYSCPSPPRKKQQQPVNNFPWDRQYSGRLRSRRGHLRTSILANIFNSRRLLQTRNPNIKILGWNTTNFTILVGTLDLRNERTYF